MDTGLADVVLPELPALRMEIDEHHQHKDVYAHSLTVLDQAIALEKADPDAESPDLVLRLAALLHDVGKPATRRHEPGGRVSFHHHEVVGAKMVRKRLTALRYPKEVVEEVARLIFLHLRFHGYGSGEWTDSAVRRYVTDAGDLLPRLHKLVRSDCTTRNKRRAAALSADLRLARGADRRAVGRGGPGARCGPTSTATRSWRCSASPPGPRGRAGLAVPQGAAAGARPAGPPTRPRPRCAPGGPNATEPRPCRGPDGGASSSVGRAPAGARGRRRASGG